MMSAETNFSTAAWHTHSFHKLFFVFVFNQGAQTRKLGQTPLSVDQPQILTLSLVQIVLEQTPRLVETFFV